MEGTNQWRSEYRFSTKIKYVAGLAFLMATVGCSLMTPLIFDSCITMSKRAATLLDTAFCIRLGYVTRGVTRSAGPASGCKWRGDLAFKPTTLESR